MTTEERLQRIEAYLDLGPPPDGWVTIQKINAMREVGFSVTGARQYLIKNCGEMPSNICIGEIQ